MCHYAFASVVFGSSFSFLCSFGLKVPDFFPGFLRLFELLHAFDLGLFFFFILIFDYLFEGKGLCFVLNFHFVSEMKLPSRRFGFFFLL